MHRASPVPVACALAALLLCAPVAAAQAPAQLRGVQIIAPTALGSVADARDQVEAAADLGARVVRIEVRWSEFEPNRAGELAEGPLSRFDAQVELARERGLKILMMVQGTPCWASSAPSGTDRCPSSETVAAHPPKDPADYADFTSRMAARYRANLAAVELWNEPDHSNRVYWKASDPAGAYVRLVKAAYPAIKRAAPGVPVLAGAFVGGDGRFLRALYAKGLRGSYDGLSVHFYDLVLASLRSIRDVQRKAGDTKPLWLAEFGWTSCQPRLNRQGGHNCVSRERQGQGIGDVLRAVRNVSWVRSALVYQMQDTAQYDFGLLDDRGARKPAFAAVAPIMRTPPPSRAAKVAVTARRGRVAVSGEVPLGDVADLEAVSAKRRLRYRVTVRPDRDGRVRVTLPAQLGSTGVQVRLTHRWTGRSASAKT